MIHFHLIPFFAGIINFALALFIGFVNPRRRLNRIFFVLGLSMACWNFGAFSLAHVPNAPEALIRARLTMIGVILLPASFYHFVVETTGARQPVWRLCAAYAGAGVFLLLDFTPAFIANVRHLTFAWFSVAGPAFWAFSGIYLPIICTNTIYILIKSLRKNHPLRSHRQKYYYL